MEADLDEESREDLQVPENFKQHSKVLEVYIKYTCVIPSFGDLRVIKILFYAIGCDDPLFLDFIRRCLEWDPTTRMNPSSALRHAWLRYLHLLSNII